MYGNHTYLFALCHQVVDGFLSGLGNRTHGYDDTFGVGITVVVEEVVFTTGYSRYLLHVVLNDFGYCFVVLVARFAVLEEYVAVLSHTAGNGSIGSERTATEFGKSLAVKERSQVFLIYHFYLLNFVRCTETVEEVHEGYTAFDCRKVSHTGEVHNFLNRAFCQHGETGLTNRHHVLMVTEDAERMRSDGTSRNMEYAGEQFTCNLVHIGNHQQQALRCGVGGGEGTCLQ